MNSQHHSCLFQYELVRIIVFVFKPEPVFFPTADDETYPALRLYAIQAGRGFRTILPNRHKSVQ